MRRRYIDIPQITNTSQITNVKRIPSAVEGNTCEGILINETYYINQYPYDTFSKIKQSSNAYNEIVLNENGFIYTNDGIYILGSNGMLWFKDALEKVPLTILNEINMLMGELFKSKDKYFSINNTSKKFVFNEGKYYEDIKMITSEYVGLSSPSDYAYISETSSFPQIYQYISLDEYNLRSSPKNERSIMQVNKKPFYIMKIDNSIDLGINNNIVFLNDDAKYIGKTALGLFVWADKDFFNDFVDYSSLNQTTQIQSNIAMSSFTLDVM